MGIPHSLEVLRSEGLLDLHATMSRHETQCEREALLSKLSQARSPSLGEAVKPPESICVWEVGAWSGQFGITTRSDSLDNTLGASRRELIV